MCFMQKYARCRADKVHLSAPEKALNRAFFSYTLLETKRYIIIFAQ